MTVEVDATRVDREITDHVVSVRTGLGETLAHAVTLTGNTITLTIVVLVLTVACALRRHHAEAALVGIGSITGFAVMVGLKHLVGRARPPVGGRLIRIDSYSFPSGHAMMSMVVLGLIAVAAYRLSPWVRAHRWILLLAPIWSVVVGCSRVYLGVHWASDVVGGWLIGVVWVVVWAGIVERLSPRLRSEHPDVVERRAGR